jgi:hypothetical protein
LLSDRDMRQHEFNHLVTNIMLGKCAPDPAFGIGPELFGHFQFHAPRFRWGRKINANSSSTKINDFVPVSSAGRRRMLKLDCLIGSDASTLMAKAVETLPGRQLHYADLRNDLPHAKAIRSRSTWNHRHNAQNKKTQSSSRRLLN